MNIAPWLNQTVTLYAAGSPGSAGDPSYTAGASAAARVEANLQKVMGPNGIVTQATHAVYLGPDTAVGISSRIVLPGETIKRTPLSVRTEVDKGGATRFIKVLL